MSAPLLFTILNVLGTFVFGLSGAMVAIRHRFDIFGILVLSVATGVAGGMTRDLLLGAAPPEALTTFWPMAVASLAGVTAFFFTSAIERFNRPVMLMDAVGLGVFAVAGCRKALQFGLDPLGAILLGMITAIGGGIVRDIMATETPRVLHEDVYALAAFAGAAIYAVALAAGVPETPAASGAVLLAVSLRLASVRLGWKLPRPPRS
ncbi:trimeric intracellular cation channel family protein [Shimia thalassica]|uniref:trimeric intracellular cation channel family protein n=1 Tax=Shimia thalassica TaxID=1715693 RepID=UPI0024955375|nr:trimeric intracellular cation channel family protein [Shimia thalassica]